MLEERLHDISLKLDYCSVKIFNIQNEILTLRESSNIVFKSAFVNMAQAKYQLGCSRVSMLQVNAGDEMKAQIQVKVEETGEQDIRYNSFEIQHIVEGTNLDNTALRKRNPKFEKEDPLEQEFHAKCDVSDNSKKKPSTDPLQWFGVLVPKCLRDCQRDFKQVLEINMNITTLQSELCQLIKYYKELKIEKQCLINSSKQKNDLNAS